jgi:hypothetical protein
LFQAIRRTFRLLRQPDPQGDIEAYDFRDLLECLCGLGVPGDRATRMLRDIRQFEKLPVAQQYQSFPAIYLLLEKYLVEVQGGSKREQFRQTILSKFPRLADDEQIGLIFVPVSQQEMRLARLLLVEILEHALRFYDALGTNTLTQLRRWTLTAPSSLPVPAVIMAVGIEPPQDNR